MVDVSCCVSCAHGSYSGESRRGGRTTDPDFSWHIGPQIVNIKEFYCFLFGPEVSQMADESFFLCHYTVLFFFFFFKKKKRWNKSGPFGL